MCIYVCIYIIYTTVFSTILYIHKLHRNFIFYLNKSDFHNWTFTKEFDLSI